MVPIDDVPLRKRAATECNRAMAKLEKARAEWRRYEAEDRPAFGRWLAGTFGALLTELRENARLIDEQEALIEEVELEMMWGNHRNPRKAYAAVMKQRENPEPEEDFEASAQDAAGRPKRAPDGSRGTPGAAAKEDVDPDPFADTGADFPKEERRVMFEDFLQTILGLNPKQIPKAEYERLFAQFETDLFGDESGGNPFEIHEEDPRPSGKKGESRIKEIYRILVRRLHPDLRADGDATVSAIWHDVQEAYEARNLDRLEMLLALTEMADGANGGQATIGQIRGAVEELKRALRAVQRNIREAKHNPAWAFSKKSDRASLEKSIRREMELNVAEQRQALAYLKRTLADWSRPRNPPARKPKKQPKQASKPVSGHPSSKVPPRDPLQEELFAV